ncbi:MAG: CPBP family intramembrane glutamic endopeptidase [Dehalococcoidia bacterium]
MTGQPPIGDNEASIGVGLPGLGRALPGIRRETAVAVGLATLIVAYGNLISLRPDHIRAAFDWAFILGSLAFLGLLLLWAVRIERMPLASLGITPANAGRSALVGLAVGAVVILPVVLYFMFPVGLEDGIGYEAMEEETWGGFVLWALLNQPLGTSLFEEGLFRGVLLAKMAVAWGQRWALVASSFAFALWHVVINLRTIQDTEVASPAVLAALAQVASLFGLFVGGLVFGLLRQRTGNLAGCVTFHWLVVVAMSGTLFLMSR